MFSPISFRDGLNVVVAHISHPEDKAKLGHNLGKTLLIDVIDFCLLKKGIDKDHLFKRRADLFSCFVFFLEIQLPNGGYLTVRRSAAEPTKIAFKRHSIAFQNFNDLAETQWDHWRESFDNATLLLNGLLDFTPIKPWSFRKGLGYFLRGQGDFGDVFKLAKFGPSKHKDWKPYLAKVFGFDDDTLIEKYEADAMLTKLQADAKELQSEIALKPNDFEKLRASIAVKRDEVDTKLQALDAFDFHGQEVELVREVAESIEAEVANNNILLYNARHDLALIERSLQDDIHFDLDDIQRVFGEAQITFPGQLARDYNDLVDFNRIILTERQANLRNSAVALRIDIAAAEQTNAKLSRRRVDIFRVLGDTDTLRKYKDLQGQLDQDRASLVVMEGKADKLEGLFAVRDQVRQTKSQIEDLKTKIEQMVHQSSPRYQEIQRNFSRIIKEVTHRTAILYVDQNNEGNLELHADFTQVDTDLHTEEDKGTSFRQMLCIAFDLAVLINYAREPFFHFVYHDGGLERLQNKLKLALLQVIRSTCATYGIQYIFSTLSEDLPKNEDTEGLCPHPEEVILTLDDSGDSGRLFKMSTF